MFNLATTNDLAVPELACINSGKPYTNIPCRLPIFLTEETHETYFQFETTAVVPILEVSPVKLKQPLVCREDLKPADVH